MNFSRLHARYEVSKGDVTMVREVVRRNQYLFFDSNETLSLISFEKGYTETLHRVLIYRPLFEISINESNIYLMFQSGDIEFFKIIDAQQLDIVNNLKRSVTAYSNYLNSD